jgi:hypothetical protein
MKEIPETAKIQVSSISKQVFHRRTIEAIRRAELEYPDLRRALFSSKSEYNFFFVTL